MIKLLSSLILFVGCSTKPVVPTQPNECDVIVQQNMEILLQYFKGFDEIEKAKIVESLEKELCDSTKTKLRK